MQKPALRTAGVIFFLVGTLHAWRLISKAAVLLGDFAVPMEWSIAGLAVAFGLSFWMFSSAK